MKFYSINLCSNRLVQMRKHRSDYFPFILNISTSGCRLCSPNAQGIRDVAFGFFQLFTTPRQNFDSSERFSPSLKRSDYFSAKSVLFFTSAFWTGGAPLLDCDQIWTIVCLFLDGWGFNCTQYCSPAYPFGKKCSRSCWPAPRYFLGPSFFSPNNPFLHICTFVYFSTYVYICPCPIHFCLDGPKRLIPTRSSNACTTTAPSTLFDTVRDPIS